MKIILITLSLAVSSVAWAAGNLQLQKREQVVVDGKMLEWSNPLPYYDKKTGINYNLGNDDQNLYVILKVVDNAIQRQILTSGFELWINTEGKKKKTIGISYPLKGLSAPQSGNDKRPVGAEFGNKPIGAGSFADNNTSISRPDQQQLIISKELTLSGFIIKNGQQPTNECPVHTAISLDKSGCMIYELAIPFNTFYTDQLETKDKNVVFFIGLVVKKSETSNRNPSESDRTGQESEGSGGPMGGGGGQMGGGGGSMGGGGGSMGGGGGQMGGSMGGGGGRPSADNMNSNGEKQHWFKIVLATNK